MKGFVLRVLFVFGILATGVNVQNDCHQNGDCNGKQYCDTASKVCVNYIQCSLHNREEGIKPARHPSQCGVCIFRYTAEKLDGGEAPANCQNTTSNNANDHHVSEPSTFPYLAIWLSVILLTIFGLVFSNANYYCNNYCYKRCCRNVERPVNEKPSPPIPQNNITIEPSAPPLSQNNNDYSVPIRLRPLEGGIRNLPETDGDSNDDAVPSSSRPADQATLNSVPNRLFHAVNMEQEDNETITALDNIRVYLSSSNSSEQRPTGSGHQQNGASTSENTESDNRRGQTHSQSVNNVVDANFWSRSSFGKDC